ncbi:MAG TPA: hypothetical protein VHY22_03810 [Chthoniobacteraceae bacterium]|nr:hypothetical protein [Chthoniobacteraceae bacterium]
MRRFSIRILMLGALAAVFGPLAGCGWGHRHKPVTYDRAISNEDRDPTYHYDPERADVEVREDQ